MAGLADVAPLRVFARGLAGAGDGFFAAALAPGFFATDAVLLELFVFFVAAGFLMARCGVAGFFTTFAGFFDAGLACGVAFLAAALFTGLAIFFTSDFTMRASGFFGDFAGAFFACAAVFFNVGFFADGAALRAGFFAAIWFLAWA